MAIIWITIIYIFSSGSSYKCLRYHTFDSRVWVSFCHNCSKVCPPFSRIWNSFSPSPFFNYKACQSGTNFHCTLVLCAAVHYSSPAASLHLWSLGVKAASPVISFTSCSQTPSIKWREWETGKGTISVLNKALRGAPTTPRLCKAP